MVRLFATTPVSHPLTEVVESLSNHPSVHVVGISDKGLDTVDAIRSESVDVVVFAETLADLARAIRISVPIPLSALPTMVVAMETLSAPQLITSAAYGFDGILPLTKDTDASATRLNDLVQGRHRLSDEAPVETISYGLLARPLVTDDPVDRQIADLVGSGLDDDEIAHLTGQSLQDVRNRIEGIIHANQLSTRTHLAIMRAAHIVVPDFS